MRGRSQSRAGAGVKSIYRLPVIILVPKDCVELLPRVLGLYLTGEGGGVTQQRPGGLGQEVYRRLVRREAGEERGHEREEAEEN